MKYLLWTSAALLLAISQPPAAQAQSAREMVNQAIAAQGGADALRALKALSIKADATHTDPGQSKTAGVTACCPSTVTVRPGGLLVMVVGSTTVRLT